MRSMHIAVRYPLLFLFAMVLYAGPLVAQQATPRATTTNSAPATPVAPKPSPLFAKSGGSSTMVEQQAANSSAKSSGATISMSEGALVLVVVILVLLIIL